MSQYMPLVTIGIPTFNRADSLKQAVESALAQDYPNLEILISDNASTDGTAELCTAFAKDARIRYVRQTENIGMVANFTAVRDLARGEYYMWLADDDWIDPAYVSACVTALEADPECSLVCGQAAYYRQGTPAYVDVPTDLLSPVPSARVRRYFSLVDRNGTFYGVMRRKQIASLRIRSEVGGDLLWMSEVALLGKVRTLTSVRIHFSLDGVSSDLDELAALTSRIPPKFGRNLHLYIARLAFRDIASASAVYRPLGRAARIKLASEVFGILWLRFGLLERVSRVYRRIGAPTGVVSRVRHWSTRVDNAL